MSTTVFGAFSRIGTRPSTDPVPRTVDTPQLPGDVLHEIFKYAHEDSSTSLLPVLRASSLCYASAVPLVYRTVYLNRATVRPLMRETRSRWENGKSICHKRKALAKADRLVIDDIAMLFDEVYDSALRSFINSMTLTNVSKITFSQGKSMRWIKEYDGRTYKQMMYRGLKTSRAGPFSTVVPCRTKDVCIRFPPRGDFQRKTSPRIMVFIGFFSGKVTIRFHQSINDRYFTFNTIQKAKGVNSYPRSIRHSGKTFVISSLSTNVGPPDMAVEPSHLWTLGRVICPIQGDPRLERQSRGQVGSSQKSAQGPMPSTPASREGQMAVG